MYINGKFHTDLNREKITILNPATEEVLEEVYRGTAEDAQLAIEAAKQALPLWKSHASPGAGGDAPSGCSQDAQPS